MVHAVVKLTVVVKFVLTIYFSASFSELKHFLFRHEHVLFIDGREIEL